MQVKHSRTSSPASYQKDFCQLIDFYVRKGTASEKKKTVIFPDLDDQSDSSSTCSTSGADRTSPIYDLEDGDIDANNDKITSTREKEMSVEYLENDVDIFRSVDDWDGTILSFALSISFHGCTICIGFSCDV